VDARRRVGSLVYDDVEVLDVAGPFEVFSVATRVAARERADALPFEVVLLSRDGTPVVARNGFVMTPHVALSEARALDVAIVPGGVHDSVEADPTVTAWVRSAAHEAEVVASVCTGAFVLAAAGLLDGLEVTTHREDAPTLAARYPALEVRTDRRWIDHGRVATAAGISAGIDLALHLVGRLADPGLARATAHQMEYGPSER
jgi:transcriptional regulator GlxA family with amidase domain